MKVFWDSYGLDKAQSGIGVYGLEIYRKLVQSEIRPTVIGAHSGSLDQIYQFASFNSCRVARKIKLFVPYDIERILANAVLRSEKTVFHGLSNFNVPRAEKLPGLKIVVTVHDFIPFKFPHSVSRLYQLQMMKLIPQALENAHAIICVSPTTLRDLQLLFPQYSAKAVVIPNGVRRREVANNGATEVAKRNSILTVSRGEAYKNLRLIPQILQKLPENIIWTLVTDHQTGLDMAVNNAELQAAKRLVIKTSLDADELQKAYQETELHVSLSDYEGFGFPIVESLLAGAKTAILGSVGVANYLPESLYYDLSPCRDDVTQLAQKICEI